MLAADRRFRRGWLVHRPALLADLISDPSNLDNLNGSANGLAATGLAKATLLEIGQKPHFFARRPRFF
jgi:hypothetical protein